MTAYDMRFSDDPVLVVPAALARVAGLQEGAVQVIPGEHRLTVAAIPAGVDYSAHWQAMALSLREQAAAYGLESEDSRDEEYWAIVGALHEDAERWLSFASHRFAACSQIARTQRTTHGGVGSA